MRVLTGSRVFTPIGGVGDELEPCRAYPRLPAAIRALQTCLSTLLGFERVCVLSNGRTAQRRFNRRADEINPADEEVGGGGEEEVDEVELGEAVGDDRGAEKERAGHERRAGQPPASGEGEVAIGNKSSEPDGEKIERRKDRPHQEKAGEEEEGCPGDEPGLPRAPGGFEVGLVEGDDVAGGVGRLEEAEE